MYTQLTQIYTLKIVLAMNARVDSDRPSYEHAYNKIIGVGIMPRV